MDHSNKPEKQELSRKKLQLDGGRFCDLVGYDVEGYGFAEYAENIWISNGEFRRSRSLMPFQYLDAGPAAFKWDIYGIDVSGMKNYANAFILNFDMFRQEGKGLYIYSRTKGSGKTMLACCLANGIMEKRDICVKFISIPEFLETTKKKYNGFAELEELKAIRRAELLIIDDIGVEMKKEWIDTELFRLIDFRYSGQKVTVFTSNVEIEDLKLDDRIVDRIYSMSIPLKLPEISIRKKNTDQNNQKFLKSIEKAQSGATNTGKGK